MLMFADAAWVPGSTWVTVQMCYAFFYGGLGQFVAGIMEVRPRGWSWVGSWVARVRPAAPCSGAAVEPIRVLLCGACALCFLCMQFKTLHGWL